MEKLNNKISIFIPSTVDGDKPAKIKQYKESKRAAKYLSFFFGGATEQTATGYYISDEKGLIKESQKIIYSCCTASQLMEHKTKVFAFAKRLCRRMNQESIALMVNEEMYFINQ